jgi:hypothetical protein
MTDPDERVGPGEVSEIRSGRVPARLSILDYGWDCDATGRGGSSVPNLSCHGFTQGGQAVNVQTARLSLDMPSVHLNDLCSFESRQDFGKGSLSDP